jgi:hypothetical protein
LNGTEIDDHQLPNRSGVKFRASGQSFRLHATEADRASRYSVRRRIVRLTFATDLLRSFFVARLLLTALIAHNTLILEAVGRWRRHSRLPAVLAALILLAL